MKTQAGLRALFAAAILACMPLVAAVAQDDAKKETAKTPAEAAKPAEGATAEASGELSKVTLASDEDKFSYMIGADLGTNIKNNGIPLVKERFLMGFSDITGGKEPAMTDEEMMTCIQGYQKQIAEQQAADPNLAAPKPITGDEKFLGQLSYIVGADIATKLAQNGLEVTPEIFYGAIDDVANGRQLAMSMDEMKVVAEAHRAKQMEKMKAAMEKNLAAGKAFLAENGTKPGVKTTASGLQYLVVEEGKGATPKASDTVRTHYRGTLLDGTEFDSSYARNEPAEFPVGGVIKGWTEALQLMQVGDKWKLFIPAELAYGERGAGGDIGPNETLIFDIELLEVIAAAGGGEDGTIKLEQ
ncbi:MAG TPA: FKBP-type peptidyl-prolyl cis-trans isomerase [Candidatus Hydrogenedentes bacterium]|nr:FKBP-type peptidyl-prolyl cis-trans isomerase [Candidatus Hydrogenedentota bacterium]